MSDEEDESISEGFSASEDEWKPGKHDKKNDDGESSDDDDSDFEESTIAGAGSAKSQGSSRKRDTKNQLKGTTGGVAKKKKPMGQSLRARLYNKYRPPPKTLQAASGDSPRASTSQTASKNALTPNEVSGYGDEDGSSSDSSVGNHLVNPADLDLRSSFFNIDGKDDAVKAAPVFDCNAGMSLTDSEPDEEHNEVSGDDNKTSKAFDFRNLLEKANSLERMKEQIAKRSKETNAKKSNTKSKTKDSAIDDVTTLLALGENQDMKSKMANQDLGAEEDDEDDDADSRTASKLSKTKSTRIKRHKKTRPASTVVTTGGAGGDTDDSDWEEVADESYENPVTEGGLEIIVEKTSRKRTKEAKTQEELEMAFRRRLNRDLKEQQLLLHKTSLLCLFGRSYNYNRLLNDTTLMQTALKLLPGSKAYARETGTELKYFQSFMTWFKTVIKLTSPNLYPEKDKVGKTRNEIREDLMNQIKRKEARCKQDMVFIFITLLRGMGLQCRLVCNMQPLALKPSQKDLLPIKLKKDDNKDNKKGKKVTNVTKPISERQVDDQNMDKGKHKETKSKTEKHNTLDKKDQNIEEEPKTRSTRKNDKDVSGNMENNLEKKKKRGPSIPELLEQKLAIIKAAESKEKCEPENSQKSRSTRSNKKDIEENLKEIKEEKKRKKKGPSIFELIDRNFAMIEAAEKAQKEAEDEELKSKGIYPKKLKTEPKESLTTSKSKSSRLKRHCTEKSSEVTEEKKGKSDEYIPSIPKSTKTELQISTASRSSAKESSELPVIPKVFIEDEKDQELPSTSTKATKSAAKIHPPIKRETRSRSRSISPRPLISAEFLQTNAYKEKFSPEPKDVQKSNQKTSKAKQIKTEPKISTDFLKNPQQKIGRVLRSRQNLTSNAVNTKETVKDKLTIPQLDGADDDVEREKSQKKNPQKKKQTLKKSCSKSDNSDEDFNPSPQKQPKRAPVLPKAVSNLRKDRRVLSTDNDSENEPKMKKDTAADIWTEVWSDVENEWICVDLFKGKLKSVESIRKSASSNLAYIFAFQNDLSLKDVTARYCQNWSNVIRKERVPKTWLETAISSYYGIRTDRDIREDHELRRIHEEKEMPKAIADFKDHPLYALERHLLKFQAIYPPDAPTFGFTSRGDPIYSRDCVHLLHSREIWLKQARTVKLGEKPYKIVTRPRWDRLTQSIVKNVPLEIFGYWQTEDYEPPTAENGIVPRNAYGNVELFKECMLPKKTVHIKLPGLNRTCKKLGVDCASAIVGFDFHQGFCHPIYDGFVVCEEFADQVTAAWHEDQEEQERKEREKYEARVYGNWKKLIRGLLIRERLKKKYNF